MAGIRKAASLKRTVSQIGSGIEGNRNTPEVFLIERTSSNKMRAIESKLSGSDCKMVAQRSLAYINDLLVKQISQEGGKTKSEPEEGEQHSGVDIVEYGLLGETGVIERIKASEVDALNRILETIDVSEKPGIDSVSLDNVKVQVVISTYRGKECILFKKYTGQPKVFRKSLKYYYFNGELKPLEGNIISFSCEVDAMLYNGWFYVFNRNKFEEIFQFAEQHIKLIKESRERITKAPIDNVDALIEDCISDGRYRRRMVKVIQKSNGLDAIVEHNEKLEDISKDYHLGLKLVNGRILYQGKDDLSEILNLLLQCHVVGALTNNKMVASDIGAYRV